MTPQELSAFEKLGNGQAAFEGGRLAWDALQALSLVVLRANGRQIPALVGLDVPVGLAYSLAEEGYVQNVAGSLWATSLGLSYVHSRSLDWNFDREASHV